MRNLKLSMCLSLVALLSDSAFALNNTTDVTSLKQRIFMLEKAFAPKTKAAVAKIWAEARKNRNGAEEYMLLCPNAQNNFPKEMQSSWVSGVSSPRVMQYHVTPVSNNAYQVNFVWSDQHASTSLLTISQLGSQDHASQTWCIENITEQAPTN